MGFSNLLPHVHPLGGGRTRVGSPGERRAGSAPQPLSHVSAFVLLRAAVRSARALRLHAQGTAELSEVLVLLNY